MPHIALETTRETGPISVRRGILAIRGENQMLRAPSILRPLRALSLGTIFGSSLLVVSSAAQTNEEINAGLQLSFQPPGARSLAMGGAFAGLADDATAAYANPAGLLWLTRSEVSGEGRHQTYTTAYPFAGSATGRPTGLGIDTRDEVELRDFDTERSGASFLSYAHVAQGAKARRWRFAVYRHELASFGAHIRSEGLFIRDAGDGPPGAQRRLRGRLSALLGDLDLEVINHGISAAWQASRSLWLGAGVSYHRFSYEAITRRFATFEPARGPDGELLADGTSDVSFAPADFSAGNELGRSLQLGDDDDLTLTLGLIWKAAGEPSRGEPIHWSLGLVYRQAPAFDLDYRFEWGPQRIALAEATGNQNFVDPDLAAALRGRTSFELPDVWSLGCMWRPRRVPGQSLTLTFEVSHVGYSSLRPEANLTLLATRGLGPEGQDLGIDSCGAFDRNGTPFPRGNESRSSVPCISPYLENFRIDDGLELRVGAELLLELRFPLALRLGTWLDPDHQLRYDFRGRNPNRLRPEDRFGVRFPEGNDDLHLTGGIGTVLQRLQIDLGFDLSDRARIFSLSSVWRW